MNEISDVKGESIPGSRSREILIIDDEPLIRRALSDYLDEQGFRTSCAKDGQAGLEQCSSTNFDAVLVDLRMPGVDGLHVVRSLHAEKPNLPVVVISGTGVMEDVIIAMREGAWDYISKPIPDMDQILVVLERVYEKATLLRERKQYQDEVEQLNKTLQAEVQRQTADLTLQNRSLRALNRVAHAVSHSMEIDEILENALDAAVAAVNGDAGIIRLLNPATDLLYLTAVSGLSRSFYRTVQPLRIGEDVEGSVVSAGNVHVGRTLPSHSWMRTIDGQHLTSYVFVPLRTGNTMWLYVDSHEDSQPIIGALGVLSQKEREYSNEDIQLLTTIATHIGIAVTRIQYAASLRDANEQLEKANAELRHLDVLREQFIQNVAHELRTPLALVQGYVALLAEGGLSPEQQRDALDVAYRRVKSLVEIVEGITTLQDLSSESLQFDDVQPDELLVTVSRMTQQKARAYDITLVYKPPKKMPVIRGDYAKLTQALYQLLDNACKFSPAGSTVEIGVELCGENSLCYWVKDHGIGIPVEEHERIFDLFYQVDGSTSRRFGGTGMGLTLVKEIVEGHHGRVQVESEVGHGSTFTIILPLQTE